MIFMFSLNCTAQCYFSVYSVNYKVINVLSWYLTLSSNSHGVFALQKNKAQSMQDNFGNGWKVSNVQYLHTPLIWFTSTNTVGLPPQIHLVHLHKYIKFTSTDFVFHFFAFSTFSPASGKPDPRGHRIHFFLFFILI